MPNTLEEFITSFGGGSAPATGQAGQYHDRFVSTDENDREFNRQAYQESATEYLQNLPDDEFHEAAKHAVSQVPAQEREGLLGGLLSALTGSNANGNRSGGPGVPAILAGVGGLESIAKVLGLGSTDPKEMTEDDAAKVINYARKENPDALRQTVQEKPWFVKAMGNPVVIAALTMAATKMLSSQRR